MSIAIIGTGAAAWQDFRTSFIDDKVVYAMVAAGVLVQLASFDLDVLAVLLAGVLVIIGAGYLLYSAGQLGMGLGALGGDDDIGAIAGGAQSDLAADAAAGAGDKQGFALQGHGRAPWLVIVRLGHP